MAISAPKEGVIAALWTPTDAHGRVLRDELAAQVQFLRAKGVHGLMVLGSTGEFPHIEPGARKDLLETVLSMAGPLSIMANVSDIRPAVVADLARSARGLGAHSVAVLAPWFYPLAQDDLQEFFVRTGEAAELPVFLYNFPERTGNRIALETIAKVAARTTLAGVKQSGAEFEYHQPLAALGREKGFVVFTGNEARLAEAMALGVAGCVSGLANAVPELVVEIFSAVKLGEVDRAERATARTREVTRLVDGLEFPLNVAAAMEARGLPVGHPKSLVSAATRGRYERLAAALRSLYVDWGLA